jgi:hypothetical protein
MGPGKICGGIYDVPSLSARQFVFQGVLPALPNKLGASLPCPLGGWWGRGQADHLKVADIISRAFWTKKQATPYGAARACREDHASLMIESAAIHQTLDNSFLAFAAGCFNKSTVLW